MHRLRSHACAAPGAVAGPPGGHPRGDRGGVDREGDRGRAEAASSTVGIVLAAVSLLVMPFLSYAQRRAGRELGSASAVGDSKQTLLCTYLSGVLLLGLVLNSLFGWSWADPVVALVIAAVAVVRG